MDLSALLPLLGQMGGQAGASAGIGAGSAAGIPMAGMNPAMLAMIMGPELLKQFPGFKDKPEMASAGILPMAWYLGQQSGMGPLGMGLFGGLKGLISPKKD